MISNRNNDILKWLKNNRRTLSKSQEDKLGSKQVGKKRFQISSLQKFVQGVFGHRYGLKTGTESIVRENQDVWVYMSRL